MKYIKKFVIPSLLTVSIFILLLILRTVPTSKLWKGFSVLYVPCDTDSKIVLDTLKDVGCKDVISFYNQKVPFVNQFLPIKSDEHDSYLSKRNAYFFDKDRTVMIYYIPDSYSKEAKKGCELLISRYSIDAGLDSKSSFPLLTPIICIIVAVLFLIISKNRIIFLAASVFPIIYSFTMPFYTNASCVCIYLYSIYLCQKIWNRKNAFSCIKNNFYILILFAVSLTGTFFSSFVSGFMFMLCIAASFLLLYMIHNLEIIKDSKLRFCPVLMRNAFLMNVININSIKKALIPAIAVSVLFILYITSVNIFTISNSTDLSFPMPTMYNVNNDIPTLDDYIVWNWNAVTKPYKSLNNTYSDTPVDGENIVIQRFKNSDEGIVSTEEVLYSFDDEFKSQTVNLIDDLQYPALEKLMKNQQSGFSVDYSYGTGEKFSKVNVILMLVLILIPCFMILIYFNGRRKYGNAD